MKYMYPLYKFALSKNIETFRTLLLSIAIIGITMSVHALNAPESRVREHKSWMKAKFPKQNASLEDKLRGVVEVLYANLQEPEAKDLLESMRNECQEYSPYTTDVEEYINNIGGNRVDSELKWRRGAVSYFHDYAKSKLGEFNPTTVLLRILQLQVENLITCQEDNAKQFAVALQQKYETDHSEENLEMATVGEAVAMKCRLDYQYSLSSKDYIDIMQLEGKVKKVFPPQSDEADLWKILAYNSIGNVMENICNERDFNAVVKGTEFEYKTAPEDGTEYYTLGESRNLLLNTPWYFKEAYNVSIKLYGENHPISNMMLYESADFDSNNFALNKDVVDRLNDCFEYFRYYYPDNQIEALRPRIKSLMLCSTLNLPNQDLRSIDNVFDPYLQHFREGSFKYLNNKYYNAVLSTRLSPTPSLEIYPFTQEVDQCDALDAGKKQLIKFKFCKDIYAVDPESTKNTVSDIYSTYLGLKDLSYDYIQLATELIEFYVSVLFDFKTATFISNNKCRALEKLEGKLSSVYRENICDYWDLVSISDPDQASELIKLQIEIEELNHDSLRDYYVNKLKLMEVSIYEIMKNDYRKGEKLLREFLKNNENNPDDEYVKLAKLKLARIVAKRGGNTNEYEPIISDALQEVLNEKIIERDLSTLEELYYYFDEQRDVENARKVVETALEAYKAKTGSLYDDTYLMWRGRQANILAALGDVNSVRRIISEDLDIIESTPYYSPTISLLNYIWTGYYAVKQDNNGDLMLFYFLQKFGKYVLGLYQSTGDKNTFERVQLAPYLSELIHVVTSFKTYLNNIDGTVPDEIKTKNELNRAQMEEQLPIFIDWGNMLIEDIPKNIKPEHKNNYVYLMLQFSKLMDVWYGNDKLAENYMQKAAKLASGTDNLTFMVENYRANYYMYHGDMDKAEKSIRFVANNIKNNPYADFNSRKYIPYFYFNYYKNKGMNSEAIAQAKNFYDIMHDELNTHFQLMTVSDQENFMNMHGDPVALISTMLEYEPEKLAVDVYDGLLYRTGMQLRSQQSTQQTIALSGDETLKALNDSLIQLNLLKSRIDVKKEDVEGQAAYFEAMRKIRRIEQQIFDKTADARKDVVKSVRWSEIRDALKEDEAAIEFAFSDKHIMALIVKKGCSAPKVVQLTNTKELEDYLKGQHTRNSAALAMKIYGTGKSELYQRIWQPMEPELTGVATIFLTSPGILNGISFNAMLNNDGEYLFDKYSIHQLTTTTQILEPSLGKAPNSIALMGDILFDSKQKDLVGKPADGKRSVNEDISLEEFDTRGSKRQYFSYLPFTAVEIDEISKEMSAMNVTTKRHDFATEEELRNIANTQPDILHLATHGFFIPDEGAALKIPYMLRFKGMIGSSMQRAGIALAGAEKAWLGGDLPATNDGILTASEISQLNLKGTQLVVLSACETALGSYSYEGVFGLPRGFKQAGVKSLIVSLWKVSDNSTSEFMTHFYKSWKNGEDMHMAYRNAIKSVREKYPEPFYWAPFILLDAK